MGTSASRRIAGLALHAVYCSLAVVVAAACLVADLPVVGIPAGHMAGDVDDWRVNPDE